MTARHYRILSLDGGGIRGVLTSRLLERLAAARPGFSGKIDLVAGTSTGGIMALALAAGFSPEEISEMYRAGGSEVFRHDMPADVGESGLAVLPEYDNEPLARELKALFKDRRLGDLPMHVLVSAFDLDSGVATEDGLRSWKPKFFHNFEDRGFDDRDQLVSDVALRTSAAPTYFPIYQGFVDGGVVANDPSMCAVAQALNKQTGAQAVGNLVLLSVGTGANPRWIESDDDDWGFVQWAPQLLPIMFEGASGIADYECRQLLGPRYLRLNPRLPKPIGLGAVDEIPLLEKIADGVDLAAARRWLARYWSD